MSKEITTVINLNKCGLYPNIRVLSRMNKSEFAYENIYVDAEVGDDEICRISTKNSKSLLLIKLLTYRINKMNT